MTSSDCNFGLEDAPEVLTGGISAQSSLQTQYEDCSESPLDEDCVEYWNIGCTSATDVDCIIQTITDSCISVDMGCQVNFLRAFCEKFELDVCSTNIFKRGLQKQDGCVPGDWKCPGFQEMFGGPVGVTECDPWDLPCTLLDQYGNTNSAATEYPYMAAMPKSTLTSAELRR